MRHRKAGRQFGRNTSHRRAMLRALATNLVAHERIETTDAKAKELRRVAERMITRAIRLGPVAYTPHDKLSLADRARRQAAQRQMARFLRRFAVVTAEAQARKIDVVEKVFVDLARRFKDRPGGYTRIVKTGRRRGDNAPMSIVEFVVRGEANGDKAKASTASTKQEGSKPKPAGKPAAASLGSATTGGSEPTAKADDKAAKAEKAAKAAAKPEEAPSGKTEARKTEAGQPHRAKGESEPGDG